MRSDIADHILVVDDQDHWRLLLTTLLESEGFKVSRASSFQDAKSILDQSTFNVVVLDVKLDDESASFNVEGLKLLRLIKADTPRTGLILVTGYPESIKGKPEAADALILKARFNSDEFKRRVRELVKASRGSSDKNQNGKQPVLTRHDQVSESETPSTSNFKFVVLFVIMTLIGLIRGKLKK